MNIIRTVAELEELPRERHFLVDRFGDMVFGYGWGWSAPYYDAQTLRERRFPRGHAHILVRDFGPFALLTPTRPAESRRRIVRKDGPEYTALFTALNSKIGNVWAGETRRLVIEELTLSALAALGIEVVES